MINFFISSRYKINRRLLKSEVESFLLKKGYSQKSVLNIVFVGKTKMKKIALEYKKEDVALPVLSFSYLDKLKDPFEKQPELDNFLGEVFVCYPQAVLLAAERNKKVDAMMLELLKHGITNIIK